MLTSASSDDTGKKVSKMRNKTPTPEEGSKKPRNKRRLLVSRKTPQLLVSARC